MNWHTAGRMWLLRSGDSVFIGASQLPLVIAPREIAHSSAAFSKVVRLQTRFTYRKARVRWEAGETRSSATSQVLS